MRRKGGGKGGQ